MKNYKWILQIALWILTFELIGAFMGYITQANIPAWYAHLYKSPLTPPGYVFSIVWSALYCLLAVIGFILFKRRHLPLYKNIFMLFCIQMVMNFLWTPIFFQLHWIGVGFIWLLVMVTLNGVMVWKCRNDARDIAIMLLPYLFWLEFAAYLNGVIWAQNCVIYI
jgi:translocator protein